MKKSVLIALFGAASVVAYGQGNINFANYYSSAQATGITYGNGPDVGWGVGPEISVELLYGASTDTAISLMTLLAASITAVGENGVTGPAPLTTADGSGGVGTFAGTGVFQGGTPVVPGTPGSVYAFALYAFGTLNSVSYTGYSSIFTGPTQGSGVGLTAPNLPDGLQQQTFTVNSVAPVPEPSSLALAGLGGFGMLMAFRRKKA